MCIHTHVAHPAAHLVGYGVVGDESVQRLPPLHRQRTALRHCMSHTIKKHHTSRFSAPLQASR
jgi:hypothetical protein